MDLLKIENPKFLKNMSTEELEQLAQEIRDFLITTISKTGGHIGPNLGVVELTLMLHKTFDSPKDKFIWDVGHQAYIHKILTGRAGQFDTLRQYKGLCGFPKRVESEHDVWETGHSSTSLSAAMGMAVARDMRNDDNHVVPIIGDGALTGGMALEALNHIGHEQRKVIVILNDNEMSIAPNVGALHSMLGRLRTAGKYRWVKEELEFLLKKIPAVGGKLASTAERVKDSLKYLMVSGMFFEELGFTYLGPVDGHSFDDLEGHLQYAKKIDGPVLLHVVTKKGKGYHPAEMDVKGAWHGTGPYKIDSGEFVKPVDAPPGWSKVVSDAIIKEAEQDKRIAVITPAMPVGSKLEAFAEQFPDRFFDVGIAEQHATTMAAGLAADGMKPVLSIYSTFLQRAYDQLVHDVTRQNLNVFLTIDRCGLVGADGETHQGVFDVSFMRHLPNMVIMMPKDENECQAMVKTGLAYDDGPIAMRFPRGSVGAKPTPENKEVIDIGTWETLVEGHDAVILAVGTMIEPALEAARKLQSEQLNVQVVNARFIKPLDETMMHALAKAHLPILTAEETALEGGFGSAVLEFLQTHQYTNVTLERMGIPDYFVEHGSPKQLLEEIGLTSDNMMQKLRKMVRSEQQNLKQRA
ncbi:1-deoxy-D-xylulose-5-phosphate synthase [Bacillaceae bacterium SIJ1]|uniref:1-deoxy-D-xylulose-5-phosphate synthase n=1 Tax=Litoribacterium kuwaitense TaxID=1398745 RepID=UPI0013EBE244|nr:1-deoxy-D-xylulose-5-phosphate synthase [Litoribacterium kuwaitense]NGP43613.1 1-deoxy-D-xylulose-5-phosphate synthase [Litoribacterium kuwaitense]